MPLAPHLVRTLQPAADEHECQRNHASLAHWRLARRKLKPFLLFGKAILSLRLTRAALLPRITMILRMPRCDSSSVLRIDASACAY